MTVESFPSVLPLPVSSSPTTSTAALVRAARHVCQEARILLTSLRGGPPHVARGEVSHDLMEVRQLMQFYLLNASTSCTTIDEDAKKEQQLRQKQEQNTDNSTTQQQQQRPDAPEGEEPSLDASPPDVAASVPSTSAAAPMSMRSIARPFLQVVTDPRAAGPHTLVALRSLYRLLEQGTLVEVFQVSLEELIQGVLSCKFEQTDAAADEAVEMAIADVLSLILLKDQQDAVVQDASLMEAFNTIFLTRNTFVHSPALSYHFEDVLNSVVAFVFQKKQNQKTQQQQPNQQLQLRYNNRAVLLFEYLVNHLLHTPLVGGDNFDETTREVQLTHDATRVLSLRLVRTALRCGWEIALEEEEYDTDNTQEQQPKQQQPTKDPPEQSNNAEDDVDNDDVEIDPESKLLLLVQDELCLSLLMTGQAIWAYHDATTNISPGFVSLEVLSEISATISTLWNTLPLRKHLVTQFETILTGFYTRALVLLRKRRQPTNSVTFNANFVFDAEVEIILESLVDILCLHDHRRSIADGDGGALETMFAYYDCHLRRSDVATGLMVELCRCCGGTVNEEGDAVVLTKSYSSCNFDEMFSEDPGTPENSSVGTPLPNPNNNNGKHPASSSAARAATPSSENIMVQVEHPWRHVPAHLKELCAQALMGGMKCLFRDDHACAETLQKRAHRTRSIMLKQVEGMEEDIGVDSSHLLRDIKSKKRLMRKAATIFNTKASRGIEFLLDSGLVPSPVTPESVAMFLRNGIVVGLDKKAVGAYLGEAGKAPMAGKSPPCWDRDWFHKEVLQIYCSLFRFENQSLLDGLRMFLAAFRLPGEAQQIDRILQAFADTCSRVCEEGANGRLKIFSDDPKRASDAAYLLSFSIIMLNTDRHNTNIREDRKMNMEDFVKNNTDYGRDIMEKEKVFPREFLAGIYESINEEEIRTEGEGASGAMTVERWKDVLRSVDDVQSSSSSNPSENDAEDLTELVLEHVWKPIISAIGALWGVRLDNYDDEHTMSMTAADSGSGSGMLGVQGARLGMDMALEMLKGVRQLNRMDIFHKIFAWVCDYTGLLGDYSVDAVERTWIFTNSVEAQSAVVVALNTAVECAELLDFDCWKRVWAILFELRDLKLLPHHSIANNNAMPGVKNSLLAECDADLLTEMARSQWNMCLVKGDMSYEFHEQQKQKAKTVTSVFGVFGRALFGGDTSVEDETYRGEDDDVYERERSPHGKEELVVWDEGAMSDCGDGPEDLDAIERDDAITADLGLHGPLSPGSKFESLLIRESIEMSRQMDMPVTGLERMDETRKYQISPRARVRERLRNATNLKSLVADTRFLNDSCVTTAMKALVDLLASVSRPVTLRPPTSGPVGKMNRSDSLSSASTASFTGSFLQVPLSPASEAFGEVLLCEIALKNKDRLKVLWQDVLQDHYLSNLTSMLLSPATTNKPQAPTTTRIPPNPGLEKRVTGLIRLSVCAVSRGDVANEVLSSWKFLLPTGDEQLTSSPLGVLDRHMGEGVWRISAQGDDLQSLSAQGWEGFMTVLIWCARRGGKLKPIRGQDVRGRPALNQDDPAFLAYRSLHSILNSETLVLKVPTSTIECLRWLCVAGERRNCTQLSIASLDLLDLLLEKQLESVGAGASVPDDFWDTLWRRVVEVVAEAAELSTDSGIRQHALSTLTDMFLDKDGNLVPSKKLSLTLVEVCVPLAGRCILGLQSGKKKVSTTDELMIEFELCIGLIFKPLRHHLQNFLDAGISGGGDLTPIWSSVLSVLEELLSDKKSADASSSSLSTHEQQEFEIPLNLKATMDNLANEHLNNAVQVLLSAGVLSSDAADVKSLTLDTVKKMTLNTNPSSLSSSTKSVEEGQDQPKTEAAS